MEQVFFYGAVLTDVIVLVVSVVFWIGERFIWGAQALFGYGSSRPSKGTALVLPLAVFWGLAAVSLFLFPASFGVLLALAVVASGILVLIILVV